MCLSWSLQQGILPWQTGVFEKWADSHYECYCVCLSRAFTAHYVAFLFAEGVKKEHASVGGLKWHFKVQQKMPNFGTPVPENARPNGTKKPHLCCSYLRIDQGIILLKIESQLS